MVAKFNDITIALEVRPCLVDDEPALFHKWCDIAEIIQPSILKGGHQGGVVRDTLAIVECGDGSVKKVRCERIKFTDNRAAQYQFNNNKKEV